MWLDEMISYLKQYEGQDVNSLCEELGISTTAKSKNYIVVKALMERYEGKGILEVNLNRYHVKIKTIQVNEKGRVKEAMSFPPMNFEEVANGTWESSELRDYLNNDFLFFVFKQFGELNVLDKILLWHIPTNDLEGEVKDVWEDTKAKILKGDIIKEVKDNGKVVTTFKNELSTKICHVRPHGSSGIDMQVLPVPDIHTNYRAIAKQSFWFNHEYISNIIKN